MNKLILAVLLAASQLTACGGGSSGGGGGNGVAAFPNNVGDTRNDGGFVFNNSTPCPIGVLPPPESCAYEQVDRMGVPAIATVLIPSRDVDNEPQRDRFNAAHPANDGDYASDIVPSVDLLHGELDDDLCGLGLTPCTRRDGPNGVAGSVCDFPDGPNFSITFCAVQAVPQIVPDVLSYDLSRPDGFPNGRRLQDPVIDQVLATAFLDINQGGDCNGEPCTGMSIANPPPRGQALGLPLNPPVNELPFLDEFPFVALPHAEERE